MVKTPLIPATTFLLAAVGLQMLTTSAMAQASVSSEPFRRLFRVAGVDFSTEQRQKVNEIRQNRLPSLLAIQGRLNELFTPAQLDSRREVLRNRANAIQAGVHPKALADDVVKLTEADLKQRAALYHERNLIIAKIRADVRALLTPEQLALSQDSDRTSPSIPPTHPDVAYGPYARNMMDLWLAKSDKPTPLLISIHGGGFLGGDKIVSTELVQDCLKEGISVAAITYRFSSDAIAPASFRDSARAVQFLRHHAQEWNLDSSRIAAAGDSAGGGISLWLGFHDDLADFDQSDPVLWESSRLACMVVTAAQTSYDPRVIRKLIPEVDTYQHPALPALFGIDIAKLDELPEEKYRLMDEVSAITHLTKDDAPAMCIYSWPVDEPVTTLRIGIHHARFGAMLKPKMDAFGIRCEVYAGDQVLGGGSKITPVEFLKQEFARQPRSSSQ